MINLFNPFSPQRRGGAKFISLRLPAFAVYFSFEILFLVF